MMVERIAPKKIYVYAVVPYADWIEYTPTDCYSSEFEYWSEGDYQVFAIVADDQIIFLDNTMHNRASDFLDGAYCVLSKFFDVEIIYDVLYLEKGVWEYDKTKVQEAIYKKWKG